jgi:NAD(P)-dependent dehydrogenase (short-subunit alcohol dehydrogenase family)
VRQPFAGKVVLITGASSGIGAAVAREFAARGAAVALLARRADRLRAVAGEIHVGGRRALAIPCDVTREGDLERAVELACTGLGGLDVAVANAGFGVVGTFDTLTLDDYRRQFETNVFGVLRTARASLPALRRSRGTLAVVGSVNGYLSPAGTSPYTMSKFAVRAFAETLRLELAADGVSVVLVTPGFVDSEIRKVDNHGRLHPNAPEPVPGWVRMSGPAAARRIVRAVARRRRELVLAPFGKAAVFVQRHAPWLIRAALAARPYARRQPE